MSKIVPYRSFTSASLAADFPAAKIIFHSDDYVDGALTWASRKGDLIATLSGAATKDANGVYAASARTVSSVAGTMPTLSKYVVALIIGNLNTSSATAGITSTIGLNTSPGITSTGIAYTAVEGGAANTIPTLIGSITAGSKVCGAGYYDLVDTTSPAIYRVLASASNVAVDQAIPNGSGTTDLTTPANGQILLGGALASAMTFGFLASTAGARGKIVAVFDFNVALTLGELEVACAEMARTQELFAGWRNRIAAA